LALGVALAVSCTPFRVPPPPPVPADALGRTISRLDAVTDLDTMMKTFEDVHPDLYYVWPRDSAVAARRQIVAELPDSMSRMEWWVRLAPFVARFGDGHTNIQPPSEELRREQSAGTLVFPPSVALDDDRRLVITAPFTTGTTLARGDRIVRINDRNVDSLVVEWTKRVSGESEVFRATTVADRFRDNLLIDAIRSPFQLRLEAADGAERNVTVTGVTQDSLLALVRRGRANAAAAGPTAAANANFTYRTLGPGIGYMDFRSMSGDFERFQANVAAMFRQVAADSGRVLIVDLRSDGGGDSRLGDELLRYITTKPYRMSARKDWKMSAEYRRYFSSGVASPIMALRLWAFSATGRSMFGGADGKIVEIAHEPVAHQRAEPFFSGAVCVLAGPRTFSSATDLADAVKTYHLATILGDETGGRPTSFGEVYPFRLPRSALSMSVSSARFVRASGDTTDHRGVVPDEVITPTAADRRTGRDAVLERAKTCPRLQ
jgi:C-terminal processing protease CtpA/Prc